MGASKVASFCSRQFESAVIKSWQDDDAVRLRAALTLSLDQLREGRPLWVDLLVDIEAVTLEPLLEAKRVLHWRSRPSKALGARAQRLLGIYSERSTLAAVVEAATGAEAEALMPGQTLWDCEFTISPSADQRPEQLPDPHFEVPGFAAHVPWAIMQDSSDSWLLTARSPEQLERVCAALGAGFAASGLSCSLAEGPVFDQP